jgi:hypothetical protein
VLPLTSEQRTDFEHRLDARELDRDAGRPADEVLEDIRKRP